MTEYWVSKKQYWCKYCNIWIRDDAPSRRHHETGLKHQGSKERYIRDLYKTGSNAKHEKIRAEQEMSRINAAAEAAYAKDVHLPGSRPMLSRMHPSAGASTSRAREASKPKDKWANYTSAKDLGFTDDTEKSSYEIEQELKGRAANGPGAWETVVVPFQPVLSEEGWDGKRKLGEYLVEDDQKAEGEDFKFAHKDKRPVRDPYDDDDWDPKAALGGLKFKSKSKASSSDVKEEEAKSEAPGVKAEAEGGLDRDKWTGRLELSTNPTIAQTEDPDISAAAVGDEKPAQAGEAEAKPDANEDVKSTIAADGAPEIGLAQNAPPTPDVAQSVAGEDVKPDVDDLTAAPPSASNLFKKRRPPPGNRKK